MQRVVTSIAAAVFTAVVLVGCTTADGSASSGSEGGHAASTAPATPTPTVMSDEEALQTGVETFDKLLAAEFELVRTKGESIDQLDALITENMAEYRDEAISVAGQGLVPHGSLSVQTPQLQQAAADEITFYACVDYSKGWLTKPDGTRVGGDRTNKIGSLEVRVVKDEHEDWRVDRKQKWHDTSRCKAS